MLRLLLHHHHHYYHHEHRVIWTAGDVVRKRFTVESDVLQLCWVKFSNADSSSSTAGAHSGTKAGTLPDWLSAPGGSAGLPAATWAEGGGGAGGVSPWAGATPGTFPTSDGGAAAAATGNTEQRAGSAAGKQQPTGTTAGCSYGGGTDGSAAVGDAVLCLLHKSSITCIFPAGDVLEAPLLQPCVALWPISGALLLAVSGWRWWRLGVGVGGTRGQCSVSPATPLPPVTAAILPSPGSL
jgi:hypothetical protein